MPDSPKYWAVIPAAGVGTRMAADRPKQYLPLAGRTVLEHSLDRLLNHPLISGAVVAISGDDEYWAGLEYRHAKPLRVAPGGAERCDSVRNALRVLLETAQADDWVLVHDAARPCVRETDISQLIARCTQHPVGGILAVAARDTLKQAAESREDTAISSTIATTTIATTIDRSHLWHAQTPQMFRLGVLHDVLSRARAAGVSLTDEASALEWAGQAPLLVEGHEDNIKITRPGDLALAEFFLS
ncbi:MAG TPA: 2-C-methyl-D-erythritol 4-phosphate cytidylyltransferase [Gammaproteobacteria bacterium]|nr:2-C-methyl-D-erythritol 4-phosphate cytidylyltransferase [Gammaproteobacteria bacterium]